MERLRKAAVWLWENFDKFITIGAFALSAGFLPFLMSMGEHVTPLGYGVGALTGILVLSIMYALFYRARLWAIDAEVRRRLTSDSSPFDPMARVYQDKRLFLKDLAPAGRQQVKGKKFVNCEIIGPGSAILALRSKNDRPFPQFINNTFHDVDMIQIADGSISKNATYFFDCDFDNCNFYQLNLLFYVRFVNDWNWITVNPTVPQINLVDVLKPVGQ